jgi:hypothetical protein
MQLKDQYRYHVRNKEVLLQEEEDVNVRNS